MYFQKLHIGYKYSRFMKHHTVYLVWIGFVFSRRGIMIEIRKPGSILWWQRYEFGWFPFYYYHHKSSV